MEIESMVANSALIKAREGKRPFSYCPTEFMSKMYENLFSQFLKVVTERNVIGCQMVIIYQ